MRNIPFHDLPEIRKMDLLKFQNFIWDKSKKLLENVATLKSISKIKLDTEVDKAEKNLYEIAENIQNKQEVLEVMVEELKEKYGKDVKMLFGSDLDPNNTQAGSLKHFVSPQFKKGDHEIGLDKIDEELKSRTKGLLINGQAGTGKSCISWYVKRWLH